MELEKILQKLAYKLVHSIRQAQEDGWTSEETKLIQDASIEEAKQALTEWKEKEMATARLDELKNLSAIAHQHHDYLLPRAAILDRLQELNPTKENQNG